MQHAVVAIDATSAANLGFIVKANDAACALLGYTRSA